MESASINRHLSRGYSLPWRCWSGKLECQRCYDAAPSPYAGQAAMLEEEPVSSQISTPVPWMIAAEEPIHKIGQYLPGQHYRGYSPKAKKAGLVRILREAIQRNVVDVINMHAIFHQVISNCIGFVTYTQLVENQPRIPTTIQISR